MKSTIHGSVTTATVDTTGLALDASIQTTNTEVGGLTETAPATDTASSGLNGRLQRVAQRLTSLIALLPTSLGQKTMANGLAVSIASDQSAVPASQNGTWTITSVSGTVSLPTGASTSALQTTGNASLASIDTKLVTEALNYGVATGALRVAAQLGNASAVADFNAGNVSAQTVRTVIATDQAAVATKAPVNANGSIVNTALTATTASSASAPANSVGFILEAPSTNTNNIRWCIGSTASTTVGMLAEPGRDSGFIPCAATISVCATVSGTNVFSIQWILSA